MMWSSESAAVEAVDDVFDRRVEPVEHLLDCSDDVARACHAKARRCHRHGTLVFGNGGPIIDTRHVFFEQPGTLRPPTVPAQEAR